MNIQILNCAGSFDGVSWRTVARTACKPWSTLARPSDTPRFCPVGLLLPDLKHVVNVLRADIRPIHDFLKDSHLCLATLVVELCHSVILSSWANIKGPAMLLDITGRGQGWCIAG